MVLFDKVRLNVYKLGCIEQCFTLSLSLTHTYTHKHTFNHTHTHTHTHIMKPPLALFLSTHLCVQLLICNFFPYGLIFYLSVPLNQLDDGW
jgi:ABC-type transport system involved in cytochrome c biogenesis permease component